MARWLALGAIGGTEVSEAKRLKALEGENATLKWMLTDAMPDNVSGGHVSGDGLTPSIAPLQALATPLCPVHG